MNFRRNFVFAAFGLGLSLITAAAQATPATEAFVQQNIDKGYAILNSTTLSDAQRRDQFRTFMLGLTDTRRIANFTLGQYINGAAKADVDAFVDAFTEYAVAVYETRLSKYKGQTLKVTGSTDRAADDSVVNAMVVNPNASTAGAIKAAFRVRPGADGKPIVTDMQVEGIWLAINQQTEFTSYLQQHNRSIPVLTTHLKELTTQIRAGASQG